jgi:hypothetical protein
MKRAPIIGLVSLLALALVVPAAGAATRLRQVQVEIGGSPIPPSPPPGTLTMRFVFKNTPQRKRKFTPRLLTRIDFSNVPLSCENGQGTGTSQLLFTRTIDVSVKLKKVPPPSGKPPKPGRFAFRFAYTFTDFSGTLGSTIDKSNRAPKPRAPRSQGSLRITDLDAGPDQVNCATNGLKQWGGAPLTAAEPG